MRALDDTRRKLSDGEFEFSGHAFRRAVERNISELEIREAGLAATVIEDYPSDKYGPSCLLLGFTGERRPLHIQTSLLEGELVKIITIYEPDQREWQKSFSERR
jgi:Domain of unknown function (DUF4258)